MIANNTIPSTPVGNTPQTAPRPNEKGRIEVQDFVKITDPNTKQTFLEKRG
jgi:hypothetical protein